MSTDTRLEENGGDQLCLAFQWATCVDARVDLLKVVAVVQKRLLGKLDTTTEAIHANQSDQNIGCEGLHLMNLSLNKGVQTISGRE